MRVSVCATLLSSVPPNSGCGCATSPSPRPLVGALAREHRRMVDDDFDRSGRAIDGEPLRRPPHGHMRSRSTTRPCLRCSSTISSMSDLSTYAYRPPRRVHDDHRPLVAAVEAAGLVDAHLPLPVEAERLDALFCVVAQLVRLVVLAAVLPRLALVAAEEHMMLVVAHRGSGGRRAAAILYKAVAPSRHARLDAWNPHHPAPFRRRREHDPPGAARGGRRAGAGALHRLRPARRGRGSAARRKASARASAWSWLRSTSRSSATSPRPGPEGARSAPASQSRRAFARALVRGEPRREAPLSRREPGGHDRDPSSSHAFLAQFRLICGLLGDVELRAPYLDFAKADVIRRGLELGVDYDTTNSCLLVRIRCTAAAARNA